MKAHQRQIREQLVGAAVLDGHWPAQHGAALDIGTAEVRPISFATARDLIEQHEYLGKMPAVVSHCYGLFFGEQLGGAVVYGLDYGENLGVWDRYGFTGRIIALKRGCSAPWAHPHSGSKLIRRSMDLLPERFRVVTACVDPRAGEIGTVYQACGFAYVGQMTPGGTRLRVHDGERTISERRARQRYGKADRGTLAAQGLTVERVPRPSRYFAFRGSGKEQDALRAPIADRIQPPPKCSASEPALVINFTGAATRLGSKSIGFVQVRRRLLKDGSTAASFDLLRSVWVDGKPRHQFVLTLGSQRSDRDDPRFWPRVVERMMAHGLSAAQRQCVVADMIRKGARQAAP